MPRSCGFSANWYCTDDLEPAWDLLATGWRVRVRGDASLDVEISFPIALEDLGSFTPALTANRPVNAIPYVCAAPPGILATADLPQIPPPARNDAATNRTGVSWPRIWRRTHASSNEGSDERASRGGGGALLTGCRRPT